MAPNKLFNHVVSIYFHRPLPLPRENYLDVVSKQPAKIRTQVARYCHFPEVVQYLADDPNKEVAAEARQNEFWQLLGQYFSLLSISKKEKIQFIRREGLANILVFVIFEADIEVLRELYFHPDISVPMLNTLKNCIAERCKTGKGKSILDLLESVIKVRRRRIFRVTEVFHNSKISDARQSVTKIFSFLLDEDEVVVMSAVNVLKYYEYPIVRQCIFLDNPFRNVAADSEKIWMLLQKLLKYYHLSNRPHVETDIPESGPEFNQQSFLEDILLRKLQLIDQCAANLPRAENLVTLARAYLDADSRVREKAKSVLNLEELLALISDPTFPQGIGYHLIGILKKIPSDYVQRRISEIFLEINERARRRMREMELSINAYFDIVFNSLGYPKIHQIHQTFKILEAAKKLTVSFIQRTEGVNIDYDQILIMYGKIFEFYQGKLLEIYQDLNHNRIKELGEIHEFVLMVLNLPGDYIEKERYGRDGDSRLFRRMENRIRTIWRSAIGQYLGRIRELDEMIRRKWLHRIGSNQERQKLNRDMRLAIQKMEVEYKSEAKCSLQTACKSCKRRPCAAERYLRQTEFFLGELLDDIAGSEKKRPPVLVEDLTMQRAS